MAHLFKNKTIKTELEDYEIPDLEDKIEKVKAWYEAYNNKTLGKKTESQCEQAFNQNFFIEILGYKSFPNEIYTIDPKGTADASSQKADAVLGYFTQDKKKVTAVVEIKDVNTSLDKSQQRAGNLSPIQQAFKYKPQYKDCAFVIATNFYEIRLFRDNQLDYESFTLDKLVDPKDNYFEFRKFYYLLNAENFVIKHGKSNTERLLSEIRIEQEKITKKFYQDYKHLRQELIHDISKNNKNIDFNTVIEKAQKIIDRVVFISFCEDLDLIPENKLQEVVHFADKRGLPMPIWDLMKGFFNAIDTGSQKLDIPYGYNGELFKEDAILNNLRIDDDICKKFVELGRYDFSEDLSVNILGHIFEQSISDIEELKNMAEEKETDKKKSKRKKEGIFYTPDYIVDYIVKNSLGAYLEEKEKEIFKKYNLKEDIKDKNYEKRALLAYQDYQEVLNNIKVLDPACGSGAFLVKVFDYLLAENKRISNIIVELAGGKIDMFTTEIFIKELLENNIYGVDLNPESVEITKLSLWLKTARKGKKLVNLGKNIKCGNSLIDDPDVAGERAFDWNKEFPEIMNDGGFDVVLGNPPYVFGGNKGLSIVEKNYFYKNYITGKGKVNLFELFNEKGLNLLKENGKISYIIPNTFLRVTSYASGRKLLLENYLLESVIDLPSNIFEGAVTSSIIFVAKRRKPQSKHKVLIISKNKDDETQNLVEQSSFTEPNYVISTSTNKIGNSICEKLLNGSVLLGSLCKELIFGVVISGNKEDVVSDTPKGGLKPFLEGKDIGRYYIKPVNKWLNYDPKLLHRARTKEIFEASEKLLIQRITGGARPLTVAYDNHQIYNKESINNLILKDNTDFKIKYILALLNSSLINYYYSFKFTNESKLTVNISKAYLSLIPIKIADKESQNNFVKKVNELMDLTEKINTKLSNFKTIVSEDLNIAKWTSSLNDFWKMDFHSFIVALGKKSLSVTKKDELLSLFNAYKKDIEPMELNRNQIDDQIDEMVFDLYGVDKETRNLVIDSQQ